MPLVPPQTDVLGPDYRVETISLPPDSEGPVVATLVTLEPASPNGRAVLHVHGFADYFFHTEYARWWADRGYTFYALDLRKYGRSLREHQTPNYVADLDEYYAEIDLAWWRITRRDGHREVIASGPLHRRAHGAPVGPRAPARRAARAGAQLAVVRHAGRGLAAQPRGPRSPSSGSAPAARCRRSRARSAASTAARCTGSTAASGTTTSTGSRWSHAPCTSGGSEPYAGVTPSCTPVSTSPARRWCCPRRAPTSASRPTRRPPPTTSCSTSSRSAAGPRPSGATSPRSRSRARCHDVVLSRPEVRARGVRRASTRGWARGWRRGGGDGRGALTRAPSGVGGPPSPLGELPQRHPWDGGSPRDAVQGQGAHGIGRDAATDSRDPNVAAPRARQTTALRPHARD